MDYLYKAFISYSQAADGKLSAKLQSGLHQFAKPWYRLRSMRVFRDATNISNAPELWPTIEAALHKSEFFVLLASPGAARSPWVKKEVEYWVTHRSKDTFLIILTDGELVWDEPANTFDWARTNTLPSDIDYPLNKEPRYTDLREVKSETQLSIRHPMFRDGIADIASTLLGKSKDVLVGEDVRRHQQTRRIAWSAVSALVLLTITSIFAGYTAVQNQQVAELRQGEAESRQLAVEAQRQLDANHIDLALLLSVQAVKTSNTLEARRGLIEAIKREPHLRSIAHPEFGFSASGSAIAFSPDGLMLATTASRNSVVLWDVASKRVTSRLSVAENTVKFETLAFSPTGGVIAASTKDQVFLWDVDSGELIPGGSLDQRRVRSIAFDPQGSRFVTVGCSVYEKSKCKRASLQLWDLERLAPVGPALVGHSDIAQAVAFSTDGALIASGAKDGTVTVWNAATLEVPISTFDAGVGAVAKLIFDPNNRVAAVNRDGLYSRWNARSGRKIDDPTNIGLLTFNRIQHLASFPFAKSVLPDAMRGPVWALHDDVLVTVSNGAVMFVDRRQRQLPTRKTEPLGHTASMSGAGLSVRRDGQLLWERQLDVSEGRHLTSRVAFSHDSALVAIAACDETQSEDERDHTDRYWKPACIRSHVQVFDVESSKMVAGPFQDHSVAVLAITLGRTGRSLVSVGIDGTRSVRNLVTSEENHLVAPSEDLELRNFAFDTDEDRLVAAESNFGRDGLNILLWDQIDNPQIEPNRWQRNSPVSALAFNSATGVLAIGGHGGDINLWDPQSQQPQSTLSTRFADSGTYEVKALAFNHAGNLLATITTGGGLVVWDLPSRQPLIREKFVEGLPLYFDTDTGELVAGSTRTDVRLDSWMQTACDIAARNLTWPEWSLYLANKDYEKTCIEFRPPSDLMTHAQYLEELGEENLELVVEAASLVHEMGLPINEEICEVGGFLGYGRVVLQACDRAIALCKRQGTCDLLKGKRGVARALAGDLSGAALDLKVVVKRLRNQTAGAMASKIAVRERWIEELRAGRNPFDAATRYELQHSDL
jgi:WD40 repeat protein